MHIYIMIDVMLSLISKNKFDLLLPVGSEGLGEQMYNLHSRLQMKKVTRDVRMIPHVTND